MSVTITINTHRRNPSGFHNKIRWFLSISSRNYKNMEHLYEYINKEHMTLYEKFSWKTAYIAAIYIIIHTNTGTMNYRQEDGFIKSLDIDSIYRNCKEICKNDKKPLNSDIIYTIDIIKNEIRSAFVKYFSPKVK